ncbi:MAG: DNA polymerase III subunit alpha, partial [Deltaproteobacteria bacterium]|nr:DNA polymerase III subunit alpha [Deltaproteobacteria bacterium]
LVARAKDAGFAAVALTDKNGLYGAVRFYRTALEHQVKPIIGTEATLWNGSALILLAVSLQGYRNLCRLLSLAHTSGHKGYPACPADALSRHSEDIICLTGGREGYLRKLLAAHQIDAAAAWLSYLKEIYGHERLFVELQNHGLQDDLSIMQSMAAAAKQLDIPLVATNEVAFLCKEDYEVHRHLVGIQQKWHHRDVRPLPNNRFYLKTEPEMRADIPCQEAVENAGRIAQRCNLELPLHTLHPPRFPDMPSNKRLSKLCFASLAKRYRIVTPDAVTRLHRELALIDQKGLSGYFLLVKDIRAFAEHQGIRCTIRGSAAGSLVTSLVLGGVDPIKHDLLFERFLNKGRSDMPDVDLDFDSLRRDEVIGYVMDKYAGRAAMLATIQTFRARGAVRKLGSAFGYTRTRINELTSFLPHYTKSSAIRNISETLPELADTPLRTETALLDMAARISGLPFQLSVHVGGVVIAPDEITAWSPLEASNKGFPLMQYDKHDIEALGLIKLDLLGLRMHTAVRESLALLKKRRIFVDTDKLPLDDERTYRLLRTTDTVGVFQLESPGQRQLLGRLQPRDFADIIAEISLFRPGPVQGDMVNPYIARRSGREPTTYIHPDLEPILRETYGVILFQEQILRIGHDIAGLSYADADRLRRGVTKNLCLNEIIRLEDAFMQGCLKKGYYRATAEAILAMVTSFAGFGFCKAHAASFAHITYQTAYLKAHYPLEFYLGLLNAGHVGSYPKSVILNEAKRHQIRILGPHVNSSRMRYTPESGGVRISLLAIKGIGPSYAARIIQAREASLYESRQDLCLRANIPENICIKLLGAGAMDGLAEAANGSKEAACG